MTLNVGIIFRGVERFPWVFLVLNVIFIRTKEFSNHFQEWHNPYLMWNGSNFGGINAINVDAKKVWKPDIFLYNK